MHVCRYKYTYVHICTYTLAPSAVGLSTYRHIDIYACMQIYIYICTYMHIYIGAVSSGVIRRATYSRSVALSMRVASGMYMCRIYRLCEWQGLFICMTRLICMWDLTQWYVCHDSFVCVTWSFIRVTGLIYMCDRTHTCVWHDPFICVWHDLIICVTWLIHMGVAHVLTLQHMFLHCNTCSYVIEL